MLKISPQRGSPRTWTRGRLPILILLGAILYLPSGGQAEVIDRIVAIVNEDILALSELNAAFKPYAKKIKEMQQPLNRERKMLFQAREDILKQLIDEKLTDQEIKRRKIKVSEGEVEAALERWQQSQNLSDEELKDVLNAEGLTLEGTRRQIRNQILRSRLLNLEIKANTVVTEEDIQEYYAAHPGEFGGGKRYHIYHLLKRVSAAGDETTRSRVRDRMEEAWQQLEQGMPFSEAVAHFADPEFQVDNGDLGILEPESMAPNLLAEIEKLDAGDHTPVMETDQGYQILKVGEIITSSGKPLEEVSIQIENQLYEQIVNRKFEVWLKSLRDKAHIKIIN